MFAPMRRGNFAYSDAELVAIVGHLIALALLVDSFGVWDIIFVYKKYRGLRQRFDGVTWHTPGRLNI
jgi:hypothetical protein